ncbi:MAG: outer membrane protein transport protein [Hyphomicrobiales bacterium]|nr:outer membrane protein transport protein [Hyphomicrobiales bacterium]
MTRAHWLLLLTVSGVLLWDGRALASAFALREQSVTAQGNAFAGATAAAEDPSYMFFNPAALARLEGHQVMTTATLIRPVFHFDVKGASTAGGTPIGGGDGGGDVADDVVLPALYAMVDLGDGLGVVDNLKIGLGINVPFGLETNYENGWAGRYHALQSKLRTININPVVAFEVVDGLSFGAGLQAQYADAELSNAIDFGTIGQAFGGTPTQQDGKGRVEGDDWAYGFTLGVLYEPWRGTRFGVGYRSSLNHELDGDARFRFDQAGVGQAVSTATGMFTPTGAEANLKTPETVSFGAYHDITDQWAVMGEAAWTRWSRFDELRIQFANPNQPDSITAEEWNDTWFFALGATYRPSEPWALRFGVAYDQSPIPEDKRTPRIPDDNRYWISIGASYQPNDAFTFGFGYTHIFVDDASINLLATDHGNSARGNLSGQTESSIDLLGVQVQYVF